MGIELHLPRWSNVITEEAKDFCVILESARIHSFNYHYIHFAATFLSLDIFNIFRTFCQVLATTRLHPQLPSDDVTLWSRTITQETLTLNTLLGLNSSITTVPGIQGIYTCTSGRPAPSANPPSSLLLHGRSLNPGMEEIDKAGPRHLDSLTMAKPRALDLPPRDAYPHLNLTGTIISAAFCIPYKLGLSGTEWYLESRRGNSALFDSFSHLASSSWSHSIVGWTGEVEPVEVLPSSVQSPLAHETHEEKHRRLSLPFNQASAPIPLDGPHDPPTNPCIDDIRISKAARDRLEAQLRADMHGLIIPVWLSTESEDGKEDGLLKNQHRWRRYAEYELYPLFHYQQHGPNDGRAEQRSWADYCRMNNLFADRIVEIYKPGDIVWIHDYHLLLLPRLLRQRVPNMYIGFFLHVPFPSSEFFRSLTRRNEVLAGILGSNMIGFQSLSYASHFSSCCTRILKFDSTCDRVSAYCADVVIDVFPVGIDAAAVRTAAFESPIVDDKIADIRKAYAGKKVIVGRDRLDSARGVVQKLMAFELFLNRHPEWRGKVILVQITSPTVIDVGNDQTDRKTPNKISELVEKINGLYGSLSFSPVHHYPQYFSREEYFAILRVADLALTTSVRDGMSTASLEYVVCQQRSYGPLILSEFSSTAEVLSAAAHINPWDLGEVCEAIDRGLTMSLEEKKRQHASLYRTAMSNTGPSWSSEYLKRFLTRLPSFNRSIGTPSLDTTKAICQYNRASKRLFMVDYDGTLTPIVQDPKAATPSDQVLRTLRSLAADSKNAVWIISGRDQTFLDEWMGQVPELGLSAEHGCFISQPRNLEWENLTEKMDMGWQTAVLKVFQHYTELTPGSFIERKMVALTWHYRRADIEHGASQAKECKQRLEATVATRWDVEVMAGKANLEVRPKFVNKGFIASRLIDQYAGGALEFVFCAGDDLTDEGKNRCYLSICALLRRR